MIRQSLSLAGALLIASNAAAETVTMTTYYPAPSGVYNNMIVTADAFLARDGGNVGIGTTSPQDKLDIAGGVTLSGPLRFGRYAANPAGVAGDVVFNTAQNGFYGFNGASWTPLGPPSVILCSYSGAWGSSPTAFYPFKAADCGGTLPDSTYLGAAKTVAGVCSGGAYGVAGFAVVDAGQSVKTGATSSSGPGIALSGSCPTGASAPVVTFQAVFTKAVGLTGADIPIVLSPPTFTCICPFNNPNTGVSYCSGAKTSHSGPVPGNVCSIGQGSQFGYCTQNLTGSMCYLQDHVGGTQCSPAIGVLRDTGTGVYMQGKWSCTGN